jgi:predicted secreted protein
MIRDLRAVAPAAVFFCAMMAVSANLVAEKPAPSFYAEQTHLDLGIVVAGDVVTATFVFHNEGSEDVRILRAAPS